MALRHARTLTAAERAAAGARSARRLCAARQPPRRLAAEVGAGGSGVPLPRARGVPARGGRAQRAARRPRALHRGACARSCARSLRGAGIEAEVYGRPKHIYSIYRKMQRKQLDFAQLFDVRAVRVVVSSRRRSATRRSASCTARWPYIPGEFDDYIATPKGNGYRSIHTAVIGPQARSVEVQIRTREMHEHAELGRRRALDLQGRRPARRAVPAQDRVGAAAARAARTAAARTRIATSSRACAPSCSRIASTCSPPRAR